MSPVPGRARQTEQSRGASAVGQHQPEEKPRVPRGSGSISLRGAPVTPGGCRDTLGAPRGFAQHRCLLLVHSPDELLWSLLLLEAPVTVTGVSDSRMQHVLHTQVPPCQFRGSAPKTGGNGDLGCSAHRLYTVILMSVFSNTSSRMADTFSHCRPSSPHPILEDKAPKEP